MNLTGLIESGGNPAVLFLIAFVLGALHGLEPGHSKTMIAAYIVAVRGSVAQAVLLGVSAAVSHSVIVWVLAGVALTVGDELIGETAEPYFMVASGAIVMAMAAWMAGRMQGARALQPAFATAHGTGSSGLPHRHDDGHWHEHTHHEDHDHGHGHGHAHPAAGGDAHARAHATDLRRRLAGGHITTGQTILFGLTGGLIPCAAAITVLLVCLQLNNLMLGIGLVTGFSVGLGVTLVAVGVLAALGTGFVSRRTGVFDRLSGRLPYLSAALIGVVGLAMMASGLAHLPAH